MSDTSRATTLSLITRRTIRATAERLFAAWTEPARIVAWWGPAGVVCPEAHVDLAPGGAYRIANRLPNGDVAWISGEFLRIEPPRLLVYSWRMGLEGAASETITVRFEPHGDATEVVVTHERITDAEAREHYAQGWAGCLDGLAELFADDGEAAPAG